MNASLDPSRFGDLLERSFAGEPDQPPLPTYLRAGRRRLRRQRSVRALATLGVAGALLASYAALSPRPQPVLPAGPSDARLVERCLDAKVAESWHQHRMTRAEVVTTFGDATLMTRAHTTYTEYATLRSADGRSWMACSVKTDRRSRESTLSFLFRTDVTLPTRTVDGRTVVEPFAENERAVASSGSVGDVTWGVDCFPKGVREDTHAFQVASARCPTFSVWLNNRLPDTVAEVRITNPDGTTRVARPRDGYVSYGYSASMTPELRRTYRATEAYRLNDLITVIYVGKDGAELARVGYPTLDVTLKRDVQR